MIRGIKSVNAPTEYWNYKKLKKIFEFFYLYIHIYKYYEIAYRHSNYSDNLIAIKVELCYNRTCIGLIQYTNDLETFKEGRFLKWDSKANT